LAEVFALNWNGLHLVRGIAVVVLLHALLTSLSTRDQELYGLSLSFGLLFTGVSDPGGDYWDRLKGMAAVGVIGALLTYLGFGIGAAGWGLVLAAAFVVTSLASLAVTFGLHRFVAGILLNIWFLVAVSMPAAFALDHVKTHPWAQTLAWAAGSAIWIAFTFALWLARGRKAHAAPIAELPGDTSKTKLTRPMVLFALLRAVAVSGAVALAFGLHEPDADWMPIAALVAMKPSLRQSTMVAVQRLIGTTLGAGLAALFLLTVKSKQALQDIIQLFAGLGIAIRFVNYVFYTAAIAAAVLIASDVPHPSNLSTESRRIVFTFVGVGIAVLVMFLADLLQKRANASAAQTT
jgi:hypothetical protein